LNYLFRHANNYRVYGILKTIFSQKSFSKNGMTLRNPKKNLRKESWQRFKWYNQMAQIGTSWHKWNKRNRYKRVSRSTWNKWNKNKGVFRSTWNKWNKDKGSFQLNLST